MQGHELTKQPNAGVGEVVALGRMEEVKTGQLLGAKGKVEVAWPERPAPVFSLALDVRGLMTVGPQGPPEGARPAFRALARLAAEQGLAELSMGMSGDYPIAVEEGATMIRLGTVLFGERV